VFETTQVRNARKRPRKVEGRGRRPASFHILAMFPNSTNSTDRSHKYSGFASTLLQKVKLKTIEFQTQLLHYFSKSDNKSNHHQFDNLEIRLDSMMTMKAAMASIQKKANRGHDQALAVSYSLRYNKNHSNSPLCCLPVEMLKLRKSCVLPHFLLHLRYISDESQVQTLHANLNRSLSTT